MKLLIQHIILIFLAVQIMASSPDRKVTSVMNVSVTVLESSQVQKTDFLLASVDSHPLNEADPEKRKIGVIEIPLVPDSELLLAVSGEGKLRNDQGRAIYFYPEIRISNNVYGENGLSPDGRTIAVMTSGSESDGYRVMTGVRLSGSFDVDDQVSGKFSTDYTVTMEHL